MIAVNADYLNDLTSDGSWVYPLDSFNGSFAAAFRAADMPFVHAEYHLPALKQKVEAGDNWYAYSNLETLKVYSPKVNSIYAMFVGSPKLREAHVYLPNASNVSHMFYNDSSLLKVTGFFPNVTNGKVFLSIGGVASNKPVMSCELEFPSLSEGDNMFAYCSLDKASALSVLRSIPAWDDGKTHNLGIGIHIDHQNDEEVLTAIANAEAKGWTVAVQWNGTATAQASATYSLRKPPIFARVSELEHPDGTTERILDWGHYVTNPENYEEFPSLEAAHDYFNLEQPNEN